MVDLAAFGARRDTLRKLTSNRSAALPSRRNTDTPSLVVRSDMRTAARGDGGADDLRNTLSQFMSAGARAYSAQTEARKPLYEQQRAEGVIAATSGEALPEDAPTPYEEAYYGVQAESHFNAFSAQVKSDVDAAINAGDGPDEIHSLYTGRVSAFVQNFMDMTPSASALRATAGRIRELTAVLETDLSARIKERMQEKLISTQDANVGNFLRSWSPTPTAPPIDDLGGQPSAENDPVPPMPSLWRHGSEPTGTAASPLPTRKRKSRRR